MNSLTFIRNTTRTFNRAQLRWASTSSKPDAILGLYLKELKSYKPVAISKDSEVGQVKEFKLPAAPEAPKFDADIKAELEAYESQ